MKTVMGDVEGGHEDNVDADATAVRGAGRKRHLSGVAAPVAEDGELLLPPPSAGWTWLRAGLFAAVDGALGIVILLLEKLVR